MLKLSFSSHLKTLTLRSTTIAVTRPPFTVPPPSSVALSSLLRRHFSSDSDLEDIKDFSKSRVEPSWPKLVEPLEKIVDRLTIVNHLKSVKDSAELRSAIEDVQDSDLDELEKTVEPSWPKLVEPLEKIVDRLTIVNHLKSVKDSAELRSAIEDVQDSDLDELEKTVEPSWPKLVEPLEKIVDRLTIVNHLKSVKDSAELRSAIEDVQDSDLDELEKTVEPSWPKLVEPLEKIVDRLTIVNHLKSVKDSAELRSAIEDVQDSDLDELEKTVEPSWPKLVEPLEKIVDRLTIVNHLKSVKDSAELRSAIEDVQDSDLDELEKTVEPSWPKLVEPLEKIVDRLTIVNHLKSVKDSAELRSAIEDVQDSDLDELEKTVEPSWPKLVEPLEKIVDRLTIVNHLKSVKDSAELRSAIEDVQDSDLDELEKTVEPSWPKLVEPLEKIVDRLTIVNHLKSVKDSAELRSAIEDVQDSDLDELEKTVEPSWPKLVEPLEKIVDRLTIVNHLKSVKDSAELRSAIEDVQDSDLDELEKTVEPSWPKLVEPLEKIVDRLTIVNHLKSVKDSAELRSAIEDVQPEKVKFQLRLGQSKPIYDAFKAIKDSPDWQTLNDARKRIVEAQIKEAVLNGVALEDDKREQFNKIEQELERLSHKFEENVLDATKRYEKLLTDKKDIEGLPATALGLAAQTAKSKDYGVNKQPSKKKTQDTSSQLHPALAELIKMLFNVEVKMLEDIEIASDDTLYDKYKKLHCDISPLPHDSEDFRLIEKYLHTTHAPTHTDWSLDLEEVFSLEREGEFDKFAQYGEKLGNKMLLWHGSRLTNYVGILSQGLRIAPPEAPATGYMFGKGVYFADLVSKSAHYCYTDKKNPVGLMLLSEVALGEVYELKKAKYMDKPPGGKHSTKGLGKKVPQETEYVQWRDDVTVPCGKPVPSRIKASKLTYNVYIVYNTSQVKMQFLLKVRFHHKR